MRNVAIVCFKLVSYKARILLIGKLPKTQASVHRPFVMISITLFAGCGATCVYGLLGAVKNKWKFVASEADLGNYDHAQRNVQKNKMEDSIKGGDAKLNASTV